MVQFTVWYYFSSNMTMTILHEHKCTNDSLVKLIKGNSGSILYAGYYIGYFSSY